MQISLEFMVGAFLYFRFRSGLKGLNNKNTDPKINPTERKLHILHLNPEELL